MPGPNRGGKSQNSRPSQGKGGAHQNQGKTNKGQSVQQAHQGRHSGNQGTGRGFHSSKDHKGQNQYPDQNKGKSDKGQDRYQSTRDKVVTGNRVTTTMGINVTQTGFTRGQVVNVTAAVVIGQRGSHPNGNGHNIRQGHPGNQGHKAQTGHPGNQGHKAQTGHQDHKARTGHHGHQGLKGQTGHHGNLGLKGQTGHQDHKAQTGHHGNQGLKGQTGHQDHKGQSGHHGKQGNDHKGQGGHRGNQSLKGQSGHQDHKGQSGHHGNQGSDHKGHRGNQGNDHKGHGGHHGNQNKVHKSHEGYHINQELNRHCGFKFNKSFHVSCQALPCTVNPHQERLQEYRRLNAIQTLTNYTELRENVMGQGVLSKNIFQQIEHQAVSSHDLQKPVLAQTRPEPYVIKGLENLTGKPQTITNPEKVCQDVVQKNSSNFRKGPKALVGVFWDIENCQIPKGKSPREIVKKIRDTYYGGRSEYGFYIACDVKKMNDKLAKELAGIHVVLMHIDATKKNAADVKLKECMDKFVEAEKDEAKSCVVLISGDVDFGSTLHNLLYCRRVHVVLIHNKHAKRDLLDTAKEAILFDNFIGDIPSVNT